jgi:hypothetical protein
VAGARPIAATRHHRPLPHGQAPSGLLLDAARIEAITPTEPHAAPEIPAVLPSAPTGEPVHRAARPGPVPQRNLLTSELSVSFSEPPDRRLDGTTAMSWTPDIGFTESGPKLSQVGRHALPEIEHDEPEQEDVAPEPELRYIPVPGPRRERPPRDVIDVVERATGVAVSDAVIDRSPEATQRAAAMGAIAFTEQSTIHLPAELGEISELHGVVAHELTHVAQQRQHGAVPAEDSPEGRLLEAQAQAVQRSVSGGVRPHFLRTRRGSLDLVRGAQRLAEDDDAYGWQNRPDFDDSDDASPFDLGLTITEGSWLDRRRDAADARRNQQLEQVRRAYELEHRIQLQGLRDRRYQEIIDETLRERRTEAAREDEELPEALNRADLLHARQQLDEEMPWEFGVPERVDPYPGTLPPETGQQTVAGTGVLRRETTGGGSGGGGSGGAGSTPTRRAPVTGTRPGGRTGTGTGAGARPGAATGAGRRPGTGGAGAGGGDGFDWQHREPTDQQAITAMFGGGLFGDLLLRAAGPETDEDRRQAEAERLPDLLEQRHEREKELRHATLSDKLRQRATEAAREDKQAESTPIVLTSAEITSIREQIDRDMPLQFATPTYLPRGDDSKITDDGTFSDATDTEVETGRATEAGAAGEPGASGAQTPAGAPATGPASSPATAAATHPATAAEHQETPAEHEPAHETDGDTGGGEPRRSRIGTGMALAGGFALGRLADRFADDDDQHERTAHTSDHAIDEEAAGRVFAAATDLDIDALSRRIWSRIRREMRTELLIDRERSGTLADL